LAAFVTKIYVHGDDILIVSKQKLPIAKMLKAWSTLGVEVKYAEEESSVPGQDKAYFLGSL